MTARIIDGAAFAEALRARVSLAAGQLAPALGRLPGLAVVLVGDDAASQVYVRSKIAKTQEAGMASFAHRLPSDTTQDDLLALIARLNADETVDGILVQLPLPGHIAEAAVINAVDPAKDVDGFHVVNAGRLATGQPALVPCTPLGCILLVRDQLWNLAGQHAVVVGRSNIVGKPMAQLLLAESCTVTIAHSRTSDLPGLCRSADILVAAVGRPQMIRGDWIKPGALVIDVGINRVPAPEKGNDKFGQPKARLVGDVAFDEAVQVAGAITPVPGGIGPMTIACLLRNTLIAAARRACLAEPEGL